MNVIFRVVSETEKWLESNASEMEKCCGVYEPHSDYEDYIFAIRDMLITPEEFI